MPASNAARLWPVVELTSGIARLKTDSMLLSLQFRAIVQLFAIALHFFLLGVVVLGSDPQVSDLEVDNRLVPVRRLVPLHNPTDGTALNPGIKRYDSQSPAVFLALPRIRQSQDHLTALFGFHFKEGSYQRPTAGVLPIRSPPFHLPL